MESQVISKKRVADHGEVLTGNSEVNAMLDLVKQEAERIESRFLEPACGTGNFLSVILERKLAGVDIAGGICYFLWDRDSRGPCEVTNVHNEELVVSVRPLNEFQTFIRHSQAVPIIWKVITSYVGYDHAGSPGKDGRRRVFSKIDILPPKTICTETYLVVGAYHLKSASHDLRLYLSI